MTKKLISLAAALAVLMTVSAPAAVPARAEEIAADGVQYVLFLGTNDKDTNKPVFTQEEAMERARDI